MALAKLKPRILIILALFIATVSGLAVLRAKPAQAAFSQWPAPQCYSNVGGGGVECNSGWFAQQAARQGITFQNERCYQDINFGGSYVIAEADCTKPPFTLQKSVRCNDGELHSGPTGQSNEEICNPYGGVYEYREDVPCNAAGDICGFFDKYINPAVKFLSAGVGIIVTIMIIVGGIQYSSAGGDAQKVAAAKQRIFNALLALLAYGLLFAFLQWLIPGGVV